mgnify:CR=1 FL=1
MPDELIAQRKRDHLEISLNDQAQIGDTYFQKYSFTHNALPEIDFDEIDTKITSFGQTFDYPFFISSMTGGLTQGKEINQNLINCARSYNIPMGVGSQRAALEYDKYAQTYPTSKGAFLMANMGAVQLNYGYDVAKYQKAIDMIQAQALILHLNPIQEAVQPEGDKNFKDLAQKIEKIVKNVSVPVIIKEVGFGISADVCVRLHDIGVRYIDTAGWGGTNWSFVEGQRSPKATRLGNLFSS